jgi:hypothetical protein
MLAEDRSTGVSLSYFLFYGSVSIPGSVMLGGKIINEELFVQGLDAIGNNPVSIAF